MRQTAGVEILLPKPEYTMRARESSLRLGVDHPTLRLTMFTDYECPYCRALETKLKAALSDPALAPRLGVVVKQFPLPIHKTAFDAAVAAVCAAGQGAFGDVHERLFTSTEHTRAGILASTQGTRIDQVAFKNCLDSDAAGEEVLRDIIEAKANGVEGTPVLFLDGRRFDPGDDLVGALRRETVSPRPNAHDRSTSEYKGK
jgi:protein-disulfide isomerase